MFALSINPAKVSPQTTREQWREISRWLRTARRRIIRELLEQTS